MHIDINCRQRKLQKNCAGRVFSRNDGISICLFKRRLHEPAFDIASVDEKMLHGTIGTSCVRFYNIAVDSQSIMLVFRNLDHICRHFFSEHREYRRNQLPLAVR